MENRRKVITIICLTVSILPLFLVRMPIAMDFPNHLARLWILAGGHLSGPLACVYEPHWVNASTNIAVDAFSTLLSRFLSLNIVTKILLILLFVGPPAGAALLNRSVFKSWHPWQISFFMLTWTTTSIAGFMSFQIGLAAALTAAVIDNRFAGSALFRFLLRTLTGMLLLLIHPFSLAFFIILAWGLDIGENLSPSATKERLAQIIKSTVLLGVAGAIPILILFAAGPNPPDVYPSTGHAIQWLFSAKDAFKSLLSPLVTYHRDFDYVLTFPLWAVLIWSALFGKIRVHHGLIITAAVLFILSIVAPSSIGDAHWLQRRFPLMAFLTLMAALRPELGWQRRRELVLAVILLAALSLRAGWITCVWMERQKDINSLYEATQDVPAGSSVLPVMQWPADCKETPVGRFVVGSPYTKYEPAFRHMPALLVIERQIFIPTLFTVPGQHALRVLEPWREISSGVSPIPYSYHLSAQDEITLHTDPYLRHWRSRFDYVLIFNADLVTHPAFSAIPEGLTLEKDAGYAKLYRVSRRPG